MAFAPLLAMFPTDSRICVWLGTDCLACEGVAVGLLRDNVEHFLEHGVRGARFRRLHALADVPWETRASRLEPSELRTELMLAWDGVWRVPTQELVISSESRSLLGVRQHASLLGPSGIAAWLSRSGCIAPSNTLGELIANLVHELTVLAAKAKPGEVIQCAPRQMLTDHALLHNIRSVSLGPSGPFLPYVL